MGGGNSPEEVDGRTLKNWLPEQSRQWKGISSASMLDPQEYKKGPGAQTEEDARGGRVKGAFEGTWCTYRGSGRNIGR